ncbi:ig-like domain-containing protein [Caerostris extrusa]|uniref:Ig-like domain-containing protein n=1 Tax=Caerostris extrusa TaxID=172846 RepID=A0AAV4Y426_CAEEX|nr:ig-like domain-containing protein [Caerostris extrusa]
MAKKSEVESKLINSLPKETSKKFLKEEDLTLASSSLAETVDDPRRTAPRRAGGHHLYLEEGDLPVTFKWYFNGREIRGDELGKVTSYDVRSSVYLMDKLRAENVGNYTCMVSNAAGSDTASGQLLVEGECSHMNLFLIGFFMFWWLIVSPSIDSQFEWLWWWLLFLEIPSPKGSSFPVCASQNKIEKTQKKFEEMNQQKR